MAADPTPMSREVWDYSLPAYLFWARQSDAEYDREWTLILLADKRAQRAKGPAS